MATQYSFETNYLKLLTGLYEDLDSLIPYERGPMDKPAQLGPASRVRLRNLLLRMAELKGGAHESFRLDDRARVDVAALQMLLVELQGLLDLDAGQSEWDWDPMAALVEAQYRVYDEMHWVRAGIGRA